MHHEIVVVASQFHHFPDEKFLNDLKRRSNLPRRNYCNNISFQENCVCILVSIISFLNAAKLAENTDLHIGLLVSNLNNRPNNSRHNVYGIVGKDDKLFHSHYPLNVNLNARKKELQKFYGIKTNLLKAGLLFKVAAAAGSPCNWRVSWPYYVSIRAQRTAAGVCSTSGSP